MRAATRREFLADTLSWAASLPAASLFACRATDGTGAAVLDAPADGYPTVVASGSHADIGFTLGRQLRDLHQGYLTVARDFPACIAYLRGPGRGRLERMRAQTRERFPDLVDELDAMAEGIGRQPMELFAHVCRSEIGVLARTPGCSTLGLCTAEGVLLAHNEDGNDLNVGRMFIADVRPDGGVAFKAFTYPGLPPCNGPGHNAFGIVHSTNYIQPRSCADGIPRYFIGRAILEARSLEEALALATTGPRAFPWHHNLASLEEGRLLSVEVMSRHHSVREVQGLMVHTNHLVHPRMVGAGVSERDRPYESSLTRWRVLNEAIERRGAPVDLEGMLALLSIHEGRPYSPCRHPRGEVHGATLGTLLSDGPPGRSRLCHGNPCRNAPRPF